MTSLSDESTQTVQFAPISLIDMAHFRHGSAAERAAVARQVFDALEGIGFMMITGHGVPQALIDELYEVSYEFFRSPLDVKLRASSPVQNRFQGYAAPGRTDGAQISERQSFNVHKFDTLAEAHAAGYPHDCGVSMHPAMWPDHPARFREVWRRYFAEMERLGVELLGIVELALGIETGYFTDKVDKHQSSLVGNYYSFDIDSGREPSPFRFRAHVDDSAMLTILYQDDGPGGLQLHQRGRGWRDVQAVEGAYVVNIGEVLERWTNDRFVATPHRVLRPPETDTTPRMSVPFFLKCNLDALIDPPVNLLGPDNERRYEPITGREWTERTHRNDYDSPAAFARRAELSAALQET